MAALLDRGFPVDYSVRSISALTCAVGQANLPVVEFLLSRGADPDRKSELQARSPREFAKQLREFYRPDEPRRKPVYELLSR